MKPINFPGIESTNLRSLAIGKPPTPNFGRAHDRIQTFPISMLKLGYLKSFPIVDQQKKNDQKKAHAGQQRTVFHGFLQRRRLLPRSVKDKPAIPTESFFKMREIQGKG
jgi:hypothetical protein